ncbi:MAG: hypothetical protein OXC72_05510 [Roseovarius sp.]|nr:hypothetical protein [Roseovarius sp.]MCY4291200.1 hypothetical protein [Roseovarius sp.]
MKKVFMAFLIFFLGSGTATFVHASCFPSVSLGEYPLGEWSDAGRTWVISDTVGSFSDYFTTQSELETHKNTLMAECSTKGNEVIAAVEQKLNERKAGLGAEFDRTCTNTLICPMIRDITIQFQENEIESEIDRMKSWYESRIGMCQSNFNHVFNTISPYLCATD